ncbi:hypothetical protein MP228_005751 [Amoeboaphelidium protococcarum]|nr:hypothetical protein MP228_009078 [Amoeboaphelidium protococcarum]KAI3650119.1 hypothetical protein MP228_005751 [Amoeboaphelidium protococcarum]
MVKTTILARISDGLPLAASMDDDVTEDLTEYKNLAKQLFKKISSSSNGGQYVNPDESRCTVEAGQYVFHYIVESRVVYLVLTDKTYPKRLAFAYLDELQKEFDINYGSQVQQAARPYAFVKFDTFIQKVKKQYKDSRTQRNMSKLNEDLNDVHRIMTKNIQDVLGRQDALNRMSEVSGQLKSESAKYLKDAKNLNWQALYRKYGTPVIIVVIVLFVLYVRMYWF